MTARIIVSWAQLEPVLPQVNITIDASPAVTLTETFMGIPFAHVKVQLSASSGRVTVKAAD